ncbi:stress responsive alpha/beta barrel protein [Scopulibacillus darangshiensis]|uniref:Stress responsive alpha/beta barrel protein n=1 Tax=Scopulibacillus darangshiensis TaxID=442528 RepID=A0A4R2P5A4_9BACL|nr:Dabb family protein [Scopulibacillus darangshiensis]TCP30030.1 stress responsive alpha/beta barrel protein [Scopulibacillus darangshiensis]
MQNIYKRSGKIEDEVNKRKRANAVIEHIVLFKFNDAATNEQKEEGMKRLRQLKSVLPGILDIQTNHNFSDRNKGYDMGLTVRFESKEALENYGPSPEHQAVVSYLDEIGVIDKLAVDFVIDSQE